MPIPIDKLVRSRRRTIALIVQADATLTVRAPLRMPDGEITKFVETHTDWILKNQARARRSAPPPPKQYRDGESFLYLGKSYPLKLVPPQRPALKFDGRTFTLGRSAAARGEQAFVRWYKARALEVLTERVRALAAKHGFQYTKVRISSARTRWGSCSSKGTLSFTYRLVMAPPEVVDYVVAHELVHTKVRNHSKVFWNRVAGLMPDYKARLGWLKKNGRFLS
ncbi:MAG TPA: SprT family zinc-dependent metalloprotease [Anaerolineales bacterium]|nr:SprT family zinc-dependent metalloprotease [Anaerolineales bacterium]